MKNLKRYIPLIEDCGLVHASSRELPLLTVSSIFFGYTRLLKWHAGYSYENIAAVGRKDEARFLINEEKVGEHFGRIVGSKNLGRLFAQFKGFFEENKKMMLSAKKEKDPFKALNLISRVYPDVLSQMGFYNSVMRYVKDDPERAKELGKLVLLVAKDKDIVADFIYREIEPLLNACTGKIGKDKGFDGDLLRYLTLDELKGFIKEKQISKQMLIELSKRREGYLYLDCDNKEYLTADRNIIDIARKRFIDVSSSPAIIKGAIAYPGKVTGKVYKVFHGVKDIKPGCVLVTNLTKPEDTPLLKKFAAIVTDEGGILSHIAIAARELKIPSVMSTRIATKVLKDGDMVEVDADKGVVRKVK